MKHDGFNAASRGLLAALACAGALTAAPALAQSARPTLDLATARLMADACERHAKEKGWRMIIAINDEAGNPKHFSRMDGSILISIRVAQLKADTSAGAPFSTRQFRELSKTVIGAELIPHTTTIIGGLPIVTSKGAHIGSIGVSGGSEEEDEVCAQKALDAVKHLM
ncbi:heme-binding protein [Methyloversatilis sp. XJ19-13]|uniref:GlcG/HbpS family heme-binding protein n=1 Tax=Methyloversatilis sp. XJ19-13 TaxID=2963430 RepID=UPI00211B828F|nr:heme-binding protein [Methyloversatilis sp. XJ19-13]MCQ9376252.1 heme-binding protein [Methyloversatilis sp. XJ19-13]